MDIIFNKRYLILPVKTGAPVTFIRFCRGGGPIYEFSIELAEKSAGDGVFEVFADLLPWLGEPVSVESGVYSENNTVFTPDGRLAACFDGSSARFADSFDPPELYCEQLRPRWHFTAKRGWINDPNGLTYDGGAYHLFYQHNPYGWNWGNMHWGHAVSSDCVRWTELGEALYQDVSGTMFSGSGIVDYMGDAGFGAGCRILFYTAAGNCLPMNSGRQFTQNIAYFRSGVFVKYDGNPVLPHITGDNRDPKVVRHEPTGRWIMALYLDGNEFALFGSADLKNWEELQRIVIPGGGECPDFFELAVDGDAQNTKWIFFAPQGLYLTGSFDGYRFVPDSEVRRLLYADNGYAPQTFFGTPDPLLRRVQIWWFRYDHPEMPFNSAMSAPVELTLTGGDAPLRLNPSRHMETLRRAEKIERTAVNPSAEPIADGNCLDIELLLSLGEGRAAFRVNGLDITLDGPAGELHCGKHTAPLLPIRGKNHIRILTDITSVEIFTDGGRCYLPIGNLPAGNTGSQSGLYLVSADGGAAVERVTVYEIGSIWRD